MHGKCQLVSTPFLRFHELQIRTNCPHIFLKNAYFPRDKYALFWSLFQNLTIFHCQNSHNSLLIDNPRGYSFTWYYFLLLFPSTFKKTLYLFVQRIYTPCNILFKFLIWKFRVSSIVPDRAWCLCAFPTVFICIVFLCAAIYRTSLWRMKDLSLGLVRY